MHFTFWVKLKIVCLQLQESTSQKLGMEALTFGRWACPGFKRYFFMSLVNGDFCTIGFKWQGIFQAPSAYRARFFYYKVSCDFQSYYYSNLEHLITMLLEIWMPECQRLILLTFLGKNCEPCALFTKLNYIFDVSFGNTFRVKYTQFCDVNDNFYFWMPRLNYNSRYQPKKQWSYIFTTLFLGLILQNFGIFPKWALWMRHHVCRGVKNLNFLGENPFLRTKFITCWASFTALPKTLLVYSFHQRLVSAANFHNLKRSLHR
jgi:hypothetical protein